MRLTAPKGTNDIMPARIGVWNELERRFFELAARYGYREIRTPIFERTELFTKGIGEESDIVGKEMFTFADRGGRSLTLRPELTAGVVRAYLEHNLANEGPLSKLAYLGPAFRQERPQAGRYQQFVQYGVECFGSRDPALDAEIIDLAMAYMDVAGLTQYQLLLNSIGCPACRPGYRAALVDVLERKQDELCPTCRRRLATNPLRILDCKSPQCQAALDGVPTVPDYVCSDCNEHFQEVQRYLAALGREFTLAPRLVRGLDYYTNTVFEITATGLGAQDAVLGGGRYDGLVETCGGPATPGIGFAGGFERLLLAVENSAGLSSTPDRTLFYIAPLGNTARNKAVLLAHELRAAGFTVEMDYLARSLRSQLREADRLGARAALVLGEDEIARGAAAVKWLDGRDQVEVSLAELPAYLSAGSLSE